MSSSASTKYDTPNIAQRCEHTQMVTTATLLIMVTISVLAWQITMTGTWPEHLIELAVHVPAAALVGVWMRRASAQPARWTLFAAATAIVLLPLCGEALRRVVAELGQPYEMVVIQMLRNGMWLGFVRLERRSWQDRAVAVSTVVMLSICVSGADRRILLLFLAYLLAGLAWLSGRTWCELRHASFACASDSSYRLLPNGGLILILAVGGLGGYFWSGSLQAVASFGFMPTSGGDRYSDPYALQGVKDGDQLVKANQNALSVGPLESDLFLESKQATLYDVFNDLYNEPVKRERQSKRAIPLSPNDAQQNHARLAENQRVTREFDTLRTPRPNTATPDMPDLLGDALFYVGGRTPCHLAHEVYDTWDGQVLSWSGEAPATPLTLVSKQHRPWLSCAALGSAPYFLPETEEHELRYVHLKTARVLAPGALRSIHVDRLHSAQLFRWTSDGMLRFADDELPPLTVLRVATQPVMRARLAETPLRVVTSRERLVSPEVRALLDGWLVGVPSGWPTVETIVGRLRNEYRLEPHVLMPADTQDMVHAFLVERRAGPDYLFAVSAATLLRELGYCSRVVSGFYARPENYVRRAGVTSVVAQDAHLWAEVCTASGDWLLVEPSPTYEVLDAPRDWRRLLASWLDGTLASLRARGRILFGISCVLLCMFACRHQLAWTGLYAWWSLPLTRPARVHVHYALRLLQSASSRQKRPRPPGWTLAHWIDSLAWTASGDDRVVVDTFKQLCQASLYAPANVELDRQHTAGVCRRAVKFLLDQMKRSPT